MKSREVSADTTQRQSAAALRKQAPVSPVYGEDAVQFGALQAHINQSPRVLSQRRAIDAVFGATVQRQTDGRMGISDGAVPESEVNSMGKQANQAEAMPLISQFTSPRGPGGAGPVQRVVSTTFGDFDTQKYEPIRAEQAVGADIELSFLPNEQYKEELTKVGMVQANRRMLYTGLGSRADVNPYEEKRKTEQGWIIDRTDLSENKDSNGYSIRNTSPIYQSQENSPADDTEEQPLRLVETLEDTGTEPAGRGNTWTKEAASKAAVLIDKPRSRDPRLNSVTKIVDEFETTALDLKTQTYLGSVKWGWEASRQSVALNPPELKKAQDGDPSESFVEAAKKWNEQTFRDYESPEGEKIKVSPVSLPIPK